MHITGRKTIRNFVVSVALFGLVIMLQGCGKWGGENDIQSSGAPAAPVNVTPLPGNGAVTLTWDASSGATSYNVYYSTQTGVTKAGNRIAGAGSPFVVPDLTNETTYYFVVTAVNAGGESVESAQVSAMPSASILAPAAPTNVTPTAGSGQVTISWSPSSGATSYNIYYGPTNGNLRTSGTRITGATSPRIVNGLTSGTVYYFIVTAINSNQESSESLQVSATPL